MGTLIRTDLKYFEERVDEILGGTEYDDVKDTIKDIKTELKKDKNLVCLCAPQIGKLLRLFVLKTSENTFKTYLNPMIVASSKEVHLSMETNASFPDKNFIVVRHDEITVAYQIPDGHIEQETYKGPFAEVVEQMIQMLDGVTLQDFALDLDDVGGLDAWEKASLKDKQAVIDLYLTNLKKSNAELDTEIKNDDELKYFIDNVKFTEKFLLGEIKPIDENGNIVELNQKKEATN